MSDFDHSRLDDLIHSRMRLAIMAVLATVEHAEFTFIRDKVNATDGNLSTHLRKLEDNGYIEIRKRFEGRRPVTEAGLTEAGRDAFSAYLEHLDQLLHAAGKGDHR